MIKSKEEQSGGTVDWPFITLVDTWLFGLRPLVYCTRKKGQGLFGLEDRLQLKAFRAPRLDKTIKHL